MPSAVTILTGLAAIANDWRWLAISWHALLAAFLMTAVAGWRPSIPVLDYLLVAPLVSVSLVASLSGNPFNGAAFATLAAVLVAGAVRLPKTAARFTSSTWVAFGAGLVAFGWTYPHFVSTQSWTTHLYASPFGILPCRTLSVVSASRCASGASARERGPPCSPWLVCCTGRSECSGWGSHSTGGCSWRRGRSPAR